MNQSTEKYKFFRCFDSRVKTCPVHMHPDFLIRNLHVHMHLDLLCYKALLVKANYMFKFGSKCIASYRSSFTSFAFKRGSHMTCKDRPWSEGPYGNT